MACDIRPVSAHRASPVPYPSSLAVIPTTTELHLETAGHVQLFEEYCRTHPNTFLSLVCHPAMQRIWQQHPSVSRTMVFSHVLFDYLGKIPEPSANISDIAALETFYRSELHWFYDIFFTIVIRTLLNPHYSISHIRSYRDRVANLFGASVNRSNIPFLILNNAPLTIEVIGFLIAQCHTPECKPLLAEIKELHITLRFSRNHAQMPPELSLLSGLTRIYIKEVPIKKLELFGQPKLETLSINGTQLSQLDLYGNPELDRLDVDNNQLSTLDLTRNPLLKYLQASDNRLTELNVSTHKQILHICINNNRLRQLVLGYCPRLRALEAHNNELRSLDITACPELTNLTLTKNLLKTLDASKNAWLNVLHRDSGVAVTQCERSYKMMYGPWWSTPGSTLPF